MQRLIQRHIEFGKTPEYARAWVMRSDERNAELVAAHGERRRPPRPPIACSSCRMLPPSTTIDWPVTYDAPGEARNAITSATSSGVPGPPDRRVRARAQLLLGRGAGGDPARRDAVDRDAARPELERQRAREPVDARLGRAVGGASRAARRTGPVTEDTLTIRPPALHPRRDQPAEPERGVQVDVDPALPLRLASAP